MMGIELLHKADIPNFCNYVFTNTVYIYNAIKSTVNIIEGDVLQSFTNLGNILYYGFEF